MAQARHGSALNVRSREPAHSPQIMQVGRKFCPTYKRVTDAATGPWRDGHVPQAARRETVVYTLESAFVGLRAHYDFNHALLQMRLNEFDPGPDLRILDG